MYTKTMQSTANTNHTLHSSNKHATSYTYGQFNVYFIFYDLDSRQTFKILLLYTLSVSYITTFPYFAPWSFRAIRQYTIIHTNSATLTVANA